MQSYAFTIDGKDDSWVVIKAKNNHNALNAFLRTKDGKTAKAEIIVCQIPNNPDYADILKTFCYRLIGKKWVRRYHIPYKFI
mgnify:CR=1 FL=1